VAVEQQVVSLLSDVGLPRPAEVARLRPGQISGGMAQRVMIALALAKDPALLIADEPTTALDVTVQAEVIGLLRRLCNERHFGVLLVTHDLGVAGELADRCVVMFEGRLIESGPTNQVARHPQHPYTSTLVSAVPQNEPGRPILTPPAVERSTGDERDGGGPAVEVHVDANVVGRVGCAYRFRCASAIERCEHERPFPRPTTGSGDHLAACHRAVELELPGARDGSAHSLAATDDHGVCA
jgi:oligopeptide/dipeptide ABC transporter ATP-binding protein